MAATLSGPSSRTRPWTRLFCASLLTVTLVAATGCAGKPKPQAAKPQKPWLHARSLILFPMSKTIAPETPELLAASMEQAWGARLDVPEGADLVRIENAAAYPHVGSMTIDLSDVSVPKKEKERKLKPRGGPEGSVRVDNLELVAKPLLLEKAKLLIGLTATDAKLELRRDKRGRPMLALAGAEDGKVSMEMSKKDIDTLLLATARDAAGKYGVAVDSTKIKLDMIGERTLRVNLKVNVRIGALLPAGLRFRARMDVDDDLNGKITRLSCEGDQLLGPLISSVVDPALKKYEGKKRPLVGFAFGRMRLHDLDIDVEDGFKLKAEFGNVSSARARVRRTAMEPAPARASF